MPRDITRVVPRTPQATSATTANDHSAFPARPETQFYKVGTPISQAPDPDAETAAHRDAVKAAMVHSWSGYKKYAWGSDEVSPIARRGKRGAAPGATIIDSMSTLKIMGLEAEFADAVGWVKQYNFKSGGRVSTFETTIRDLAGLLSAYDMSGDVTLLRKAQEVGNGLLGAFQGGIGEWRWLLLAYSECVPANRSMRSSLAGAAAWRRHPADPGSASLGCVGGGGGGGGAGALLTPMSFAGRDSDAGGGPWLGSRLNVVVRRSRVRLGRRA